MYIELLKGITKEVSMKTIAFALLLGFSFISQSAFSQAQCTNQLIIRNVSLYAIGLSGSSYTHVTFESVHKKLILKPGETANVFVADDDFDVKNKTAAPVLIVSLRGRSLISDNIFWLAHINIQNCQVVMASHLFDRH